MREVINRIRAQGLRVVFQFALRNLQMKRKLKRLLQQTAAQKTAPVPGVTVAGQLTDSGSVNKALRDFVWALKEAGIPYQTIDFGYKHNAHKDDYEGLLTDESRTSLKKYTHFIEIWKTPVPDGIVPHRGRIWFWEYDSGVLEAFPGIATDSSEVIAMSDFNVEYFRKVLPAEKSVKKILYPFRIPNEENLADPAETRRRFGYGKREFIVFFNFSFKTGYNRKNPKAAIRAFARAFQNVPEARLLFKTQMAKMFPDAVRELRKLSVEIGVSDRFRIIDEYLPERDIYALTAACDVYLSLHRGEGFGLGMAEAMSLGKPVVATDYSASTEFVVPGCAVPVPCRMVSVESIGCDPAYYHGVREWPEPDESAAAEAMVRLYREPKLRGEIGAAARQFMREHFSTEAFRRSVRTYLGLDEGV